MKTAYINARIHTGNTVIIEKAVLTNEDIIEDLVSIGDIPTEYLIEDIKGENLSAAFIDLQIYGGNGKLFSHELSVESLQATYEYCVSGGAGFFMITLATNAISTFLQSMEVIREYWKMGGKGLLGLHLEGPYMNPIKKGAHIESYIKTPTLDEVELLLAKGEGVFKMMTLAPEKCEPGIIKHLINSGILVSAGHTNASYTQANQAFDLGIPVATHLFNAMSPFQSREPGMVGAIYDSNTVMSSVVCDGIHVDFAAVRISKRLMKERLFYITDAVVETAEGEYSHVFRGDRYTMPNGTLSGSNLTMMKCVKNGVNHLGISLEESVKMATAYPAKLINEKIGRIEKGYKACFTVFDDAMEVIRMIL